jgi:RHS repeat-associated protein
MCRIKILDFVYSVKRRKSFILFLCLYLTLPIAAQQIKTPTDGMTPSGLQPGAAAGAYSLTDFENINYYNGNLSFTLPLVKIGGRGAAQHTIAVAVNSVHWQTEKEQITCESETGGVPPLINEHWRAQVGGGSCAQGTYYYPSPAGWRGTVPLSYSPGVLKGRYSGHGGNVSNSINPYFSQSLTRLTFTAPDGTEFELRDKLTNGEPKPAGSTVPAFNRGKIFVSINGEATTFVSYADIIDERRHAYSGEEFYPSGYLLFADGTRYEISGGLVQWARDRNGNFLRFSYGADGKVAQIVDSLNHTVNISYTEYADTITFQGFNGAARTIQIQRGSLQSALRPGAGYTIKDYNQLFPLTQGYSGSSVPHNPTDTITAIVFPDNRRFQLYYNEYSELARVETPTGAAIEYDYTLPENSVYQYADGPQIHRRITVRRQYPDGGTGSTYNLKQAITPSYSGDGTASQPFKTQAVVEQTDINGNLLTKEKHYFEGSPMASLDSALARRNLFSGWTEGRETKTEVFNTNGVLLRSSDSFYEQRAAISWWSSYASTLSLTDTNAPANDPRLIRSEATLSDTNQKTKTEYGYDAFNNQTEVKEYDYGTGAAGALLRRSVTSYASSSAPINGTDYTCTNCTTSFPVHLRRLPVQKSIYDASGAEKSRAVFEYDNYTNDARHAALIERSNATNLCLLPSATTGGICGLESNAGYTTRGNLTGITSYADITNLSGSAITTSGQYDVTGNPVKTIDAKGYISTVDYADRFGSPDGEARSSITPSQISGKQTFAFATSATNTSGWTSYAQYDYYTGASVDGEDINGNVSSAFYNDALDRPTQVIGANNRASLRSQKTFAYDDTNRKVTVTADLFAFGDNLAKTESFYDKLGRTTETRDYEANNYVAIQTEYEALGRVYKVSNPFRPSEISTSNPIRWTISRFDALGRVKEIESPDGAKVLTDYSGNATTITDESGKIRRQIENASENLVRVDEPNINNDLGTINNPTQPTYYNYDANENLTQIIQGGQTRTFTFDSSNRLKQATNPESGTFQYAYDGNGNLISKIDARNVATNFSYDALNRVTFRDYSDSTPDVSYTYDNPYTAFSKGELTKVSSSLSMSEYTAFDETGRTLAHKQTTDGQSYTTSYTYNIAGDLIEQTYPSGRALKNVLDNGSDLSQVKSKKNTNSGFVNYAKNFTYTAAGAVSSMQLGNGAWESTVFNPRLQPTQIALGTVRNGTDKLKLNYTYTSNGENNNNGNVLSQQITVPTGQYQGFTATQNYTYDSLNRLKSAEETIPTLTGWKQTFTYDRYGNRNFDTNNTTTLGGCPANQCNPTVDVSNNRFTTNQGYTYDLAGNIITDAQGRSFTYDAENKQKEVRDVSNNIIGQYYYDGDGRRIKKVSNTETVIFVYDTEGRLIAEYANQAPQNPQVSYLTTDALGSPRIKTDANGNIISRNDYLPFGEDLYTAQRTQGVGYQPDSIRRKFTTYKRDDETGLDFAEARYYSARWGRFVSPDEFTGGPDELFDFEEDASNNPTFYSDLENPQSLNKYQYTYNNPLNMTDEDGHCPICVAFVVVAVAILTGPDTVNAPGPGDPVYPNERGANAALNLLGIRGAGALIGGAVRNTAVRTGVNQARNQAVKQVVKQPAKQVAKTSKDALKAKGPYSRYKDITKKGSRFENRKTNYSKNGFIKSAEKSGFKKTVSKDGTVTNLEKGKTKLSVRSKSNSTGGPTVDVYPNGSKSKVKEIRLRDN